MRTVSSTFTGKTAAKFSEMASVFVQKMNPVTSRAEWVVEPENFDYHQEIARSAYADMLHDTERNRKYQAGLERAIQTIHVRGEKAHVLDIGTGTGLLSMMAVRAGADSVTACEAFIPMADCASRVIADNGFADKIKLIRKSSKDIIVGPDGDMTFRANILVTEVFDTELIGEGGISTFDHAHRHLLEENCIVVPSAANMYVQPVSSQFLYEFHGFHSVPVNHDEATPTQNCLRPLAECVECAGSAAVHDVQLSQLSQDQFTPLTDPVRVFRFDYSAGSHQLFMNHVTVSQTTLRSGTCHAVLMWWDLEMDTETDIVLSCAPYWAHPEPENLQWRDHWMQAVYYLPTLTEVNAGETVYISGHHDEYSLWFHVSQQEGTNTTDRPVCTCGGHTVYSRSRLHQLNNLHKHQLYLKQMTQLIKADTVCVGSSDGSYLPLLAAKLGAKQVFAVEPHPLTRRLVESLARENNLSVVVVSSIDDLDPDLHIDLLLSEPFYQASHLPWHNLHFWYAKDRLIEKGLVKDKGSVDCGESLRCTEILPTHAVLCLVPVMLDDLWKIRAPVGDCEGFDLRAFDKMIEDCSNLVDAAMEPQPLWEYPGTALCDLTEVMTFTFTSRIPSDKVISRGHVKFIRSGVLNGVAAWLDYYHHDALVCSTGLTQPPDHEGRLRWDPDHRQAIHLIPRPSSVTTDGNLSYQVTFNPSDGDLSFKFELS